MMFALTNMSEVALRLGMVVEVVDVIGDREHQRDPRCSTRGSPSSGGGVMIEEMIKKDQQEEKISSHRSVCAIRGL